MTVSEMKQRKQELGLTCEMIAERSGVPLGTVQKIFAGVTKSPRYDTLLALEKGFAADTAAAKIARESAAAYAVSPKAYREGVTLEEYAALPEDYRAELIDGVLYDMSSPTLVHQMVALQLCRSFMDYIDQNGGDCVAVAAPLDVQPKEGEPTVLQPDVMVFCDRDQLHRNGFQGVPDLVAEVLSPSTRKKDMILKLGKYQSGGVREYWLVDPEGERVIVYDFQTEDWPVVYGFGDQVPVGIWQGACRIDFAQIREYVGSLPD